MATHLQNELLEEQMLVENSKLEELRYAVLDMMDDYNANHVRQANLEYVQMQLDRIEKARREFRTSVRQYKRMFSRYSGESCSKVVKQLEDIDKEVFEHAVWCKVDQLEGRLGMVSQFLGGGQQGPSL